MSRGESVKSAEREYHVLEEVGQGEGLEYEAPIPGRKYQVLEGAGQGEGLPYEVPVPSTPKDHQALADQKTGEGVEPVYEAPTHTAASKDDQGWEGAGQEAELGHETSSTFSTASEDDYQLLEEAWQKEELINRTPPPV